tara:strand:+ start:325 stop:969 length:645 start_codon:yes stop_codon:yes gene_type:complete
MLEILPNEMWLNIFKQTDMEDLFKRREVCHKFKRLIDGNLKHFYLNFARQYPSFFPFKRRVYIHDFIIGYTKIFINNLSNYPDCPVSFVEALNSQMVSLKQAKCILDLNQNHNFSWWYGLMCIDMNEAQLNQTFKLIDIGLTKGYAIQISKQTVYTEKQFDIFSELYSKGISEHYSNKLTLSFSDEQLERFYYYLNNTDIWWVHIIWSIEQDIF